MAHDNAQTPFDFDQLIDRGGTHSVKFDARTAVFGDADVTPLWVADMDFAVAPCISEAVTARACHPVYGYTLVPDSLHQATIDWHAARHGWSIKRDDIMLTPGTLPALSVAIEAFTQPGDGVIIQPPVYGPFAALAKAAGREVAANPLIETGGRYRIDLDHLERCAAEGARLLLLCNPHNPVGRVWSRSELEAMLDISRRHGLTIVSDDIHGDLTYDDAEYL
ncbi:MAG TPA: aminotransferase class I/II-fold pyridoxal phosphate-dependent enzyme, partial [Oleiagrimonas sp.]|nr:aminotransferase class I/II-fold pyridoxal phosphate-dependent enzyme [Oleiagrimonas sp.]